MKAVIIDDETNARKTLRELLALNCPQVQLVREAEGVASGIELIREVQPDLVFLDIQLNGRSGFELLDHFSKPDFHLIFSTAFDRFALQAFKYNAVDYLLKPIDPDDLIEAVERAGKRGSALSSDQNILRLLESMRSRRLDKIALSTNEGLTFIRLDDIIRLEATSNYTIFYTLDKEKIIVARTIKEFEDLLPSDQFWRPHQSHIVNLDHVKKVLKEDGGFALTEDEVRIPISRRKKDGFLEALTRRSIQ